MECEVNKKGKKAMSYNQTSYDPRAAQQKAINERCREREKEKYEDSSKTRWDRREGISTVDMD